MVTGYGQLPTDGAEVTHVPAFARIDAATGETTIVLDRDNPNNGIVIDSTVAGDTLVAVGEAPNGDNWWGPGIWTSKDGVTWQRAETPEDVASVIVDLDAVVASNGTMVSVGTNNYGNEPPYVLWSLDGSEWQAARLPEVALDEEVRLAGVVHTGSEFVIVGELSHDSYGEIVWRSRDGVNWDRDQALPMTFGDGPVDTSGVWGGNGAVLVGGQGIHRHSIQYCVDDPETCRRPFNALWLHEGETWQRLRSPSRERAYNVAIANGHIVRTGRVGDAGAVLVWVPGGDDLLPVAPPFDISPPVSEYPELGREAVIEAGSAYVAPLSDACYRMSYLGFINGVHWVLEDGPMQLSPDWPVKIGPGPTGDERTVFGTIELVLPEQIAYTVDGFGVVATYAPAPDDYEPYGCF